MPAEPELRRATVADLNAMFSHIRVGFASYVQFAPPGWQPPPVPLDRGLAEDQVSDPAAWTMIAVLPDATLGHVSFRPARERSDSRSPGRRRPLVPGLAHLGQLFVVPDRWGTGLAGRLHDAGAAEMRARGFTEARLFTPSAHARARHFYERRGWMATGDWFHPELRLMTIEYRLALSS